MEASRFRDTRFTCNLTVPAAAQLLRVSERTIHNWESGAARVPYAAYRLLRIVRGGEFVHPSWKGWAVRGDTLWSPEGHGFRAADSSWWSLLIRQAREFRNLLIERQKSQVRDGGEAAAALGLSLLSISDKPSFGSRRSSSPRSPSRRRKLIRRRPIAGGAACTRISPRSAGSEPASRCRFGKSSKTSVSGSAFEDCDISSSQPNT